MNVLNWLIDKHLSPHTVNGGGTVHLKVAQNAVTPEWHSRWRPDDCGAHETRRHVGYSAEGFHPGIEVCYRAGMGRIEWGEACSTPETARARSTQMEDARREGFPVCAHAHSASAPSSCCLYLRGDADVESALLELREIVAMIENDPGQNWPRFHHEFERAVAGLQQSIVALWIQQEQR